MRMKEAIVEHLNAVQKIIESKSIYSFSFNLSDLPAHNNYQLDIRRESKFEELFQELDNKKTYCLYWFECVDTKNAENLIAILNSKREKLYSGEDIRNVPPKNGNSQSKVIYVGVRQGGVRKRDNLSNLSGRICQHLGYYKKGGTGAMQFLHWAFGKDYKIALNVIEIGTPEHKEYLYIIEKFASIVLKPLCGIH